MSAEKSINSVFSHMGGRILVDPCEDVPAHKGQLKDDSQNQKRADATQLPDPGSVQKRADLEPGHKCVDPISKVLIL
jgi:hypothetical protein